MKNVFAMDGQWRERGKNDAYFKLAGKSGNSEDEHAPVKYVDR